MHGWRPHIESALCLSLDRLLATRCIVPGERVTGILRWDHDGEELASARFKAELGTNAGTLTLHYTHAGRNSEPQAVTCTIVLSTVPLHYGGLRWYMQCPYTGRRALKLYKWAGIKQFCHREAIQPKPTYASQRVSGSDRIMAQRWVLRRKLGDHASDLTCDPYKPKWMRWRTFQQYLDRDADLEAREAPYFTRMLDRLGVAIPGYPMDLGFARRHSTHKPLRRKRAGSV